MGLVSPAISYNRYLNRLQPPREPRHPPRPPRRDGEQNNEQARGRGGLVKYLSSVTDVIIIESLLGAAGGGYLCELKVCIPGNCPAIVEWRF